MRALQNEGTITLSLFRHTNKHSAINFVKSSQTVLEEMTQYFPWTAMVQWRNRQDLSSTGNNFEKCLNTFFQVLKSAIYHFLVLLSPIQMDIAQQYSAPQCKKLQYIGLSDFTGGLTEERADQEEQIAAVTLSSAEMLSNPLQSYGPTYYQQNPGGNVSNNIFEAPFTTN